MFRTGPTPQESSPASSIQGTSSIPETLSMSSISHHRVPSSTQLAVEQDLTVLLTEIARNQATVLDSLKEGNWRLEDAAVTFDLEQESKKAASYMAKLHAIRQSMMETKRRLARLQERSLRVRNTADKINEEAYKEWLEEIAYEKQLLAKFEPGYSPRSNSTGRPDNR